jgi:hypothetical protein
VDEKKRDIYKADGFRLQKFVFEKLGYDVRSLFSIEINDVKDKVNNIEGRKGEVMEAITKLQDSKKLITETLTKPDLKNEDAEMLRGLLEKLETELVTLKNAFILLDDEKSSVLGIVEQQETEEFKNGDEVDFAQPGYEDFREIQINQLIMAGIPFIALERSYTIEEIRDIYQRISIFFIQFPEAFGLPVLECLCSGAQIFTPDSGWPMSWRLNEKPEVHGSGILPYCFTVYDDENDLLKKLLAFKENFKSSETPLDVFSDFKHTYPTFYEGDQAELKRLLEFINSYKN